MPTKKSTAKTNAKKSPAKTQTKAPPAPPPSKTPLLDQAKMVNPHKAEGAGGWDRNFALAIAQEFAAQVSDDMTVKDMLAIEVTYKDFAGWSNLHEALLAARGLRRLKSPRNAAIADAAPAA